MYLQSWWSLAERQCGLLTTAQLEAVGVSAFERRRFVDQGVLARRARRVWAVAGWPDGWPRPMWEAVLQAGPPAVLFRRTAAAAWGMDGLSVPPPGPTVELALPEGHQSRRKTIYRVPSLLPVDVTVHNDLPVTTAARTVADLGAAEPLGVVERAAEWALRNRLAAIVELQGLAERLHTKGGRALKAVLAARPPGSPATESDAETLFVQLVRAAGLPEPVRQFWVVLGGRRYRLDFAWPAWRLAVEIDGAAVHGPGDLSRDLRRQNRIILDGWMILRFTWAMLTRSRREVEDDLWTAWALRGGFVPARRGSAG